MSKEKIIQSQLTFCLNSRAMTLQRAVLHSVCTTLQRIPKCRRNVSKKSLKYLATIPRSQQHLRNLINWLIWSWQWRNLCDYSRPYHSSAACHWKILNWVCFYFDTISFSWTVIKRFNISVFVLTNRPKLIESILIVYHFSWKPCHPSWFEYNRPNLLHGTQSKVLRWTGKIQTRKICGRTIDG